MQWSRLSVRRVEARPAAAGPLEDWTARIPAVRQLLQQGLDLGAATVLVGENGAGKSTLVEAVAMRFGLGAEGGSTGALHSTRASESHLWQHLQLVRNAGSARTGYFLRAETMHGLYTYLEQNPGGPEPRFHEMSHGESFTTIIEDRFRDTGFWVLDEPESALSFTGCLRLLGHLKDVLADGGQVLMSTHSPLLAALPGATLYEVGEWGLRESSWQDLELVGLWRGFLDAPERFLRHL